MFDISYIKLTFRIKFKKSGSLSIYKMSTLRGGMGHVLMKSFCTQKEGNCNKCIINENCLVQEILTPKIDIDLPFLKNVKTSNSGFVIECDDFRTQFKSEDEMNFTMLLFNKSCKYISHFIYAFDKLGQIGLGKDRLEFSLVDVCNQDKKIVFKDGYLYKENIYKSNLAQYISKRKKELSKIKGIEFIVPLRILRNGKLIDDLNYKDLVYSMARRIAILSVLEGNYVDFDVNNVDNFIKDKKIFWTENERYSNRQKSKMSLGGILGEVYFTEDIDKIDDMLIACELIHIGKNTTFGLGKYIIKEG